jgi:hypothetical protein
MGVLCVCDRCGNRLMPQSDDALRRFAITDRSGQPDPRFGEYAVQTDGYRVDLCGLCVDLFVRWMKEV